MNVKDFINLIKDGEIETCKNLISRSETLKIDLNSYDEKNRTLFWYCCYFGCKTLIESLFEKKSIDYNKHDNEGITPFLISVWSGHHELVRFLLTSGDSGKIDYNKPDKNGYTSFSSVCKSGDMKMFNILFENENISKETLTNENETPLLLACMNNNILIIEALVSKRDCINLNINQPNKNGLTPLFRVCWHENFEAAKLLFRIEDIDINLGCFGYTPLGISLINKNKQLTDLILKYK